jgi:uncharacterized protein YdeI (YjbR/CyaY-like superfamily)
VAQPRFFPTPGAFRDWLAKNHHKSTEVLVGFYKKDSAKPSITWPESVDAALCFGWIDGVRRRIDEVSYSIRFTPRKPGSIWSAVNIKRVAELTGLSLMQPTGIQAFEARLAERSAIYAFEQSSVAFDAYQESEFKKNKAAWKFFQSQPAWYKKTATWWVVSAKRPETKASRLKTLIADSAAKRTIRRLTRASTK